jgi:HAD superfamily hydrolase (TIGR01509 family)
MRPRPRQTRSMIEAVVFDFDGLLVDTEWPGFEVWRDLFADHGAELTIDDFLVCIGTRNAIDWGELLSAKTGRSGPSDEELRTTKVARQTETVAELPLRDGVAQWLADVTAAGLRCAIASSSERLWIEPHLDRLEVAHHFELLATWEGPECGFPPKPAPDLYLQACRALGVAPRAALAVEDSVNGVLAAKAAGMYCLAVPNRVTRGCDFGAADVVAASLADLRLADALAALAGNGS